MRRDSYATGASAIFMVYGRLPLAVVVGTALAGGPDLMRCPPHFRFSFLKGMVMAARFQVLLTRVRQGDPVVPVRDERTCPEVVCEAFVTETAEQAQAMFRSLCALGS